MKKLLGLSLLMVVSYLPAGFIGNKSSTATASAATLTRPSYGDVSIEIVYIYDENGVPELASTDSYTSGHIFDDDDNLVGSVPNPLTDGSIYDANNNNIGFIDPSPEATAQLGE